MTNPKAEPVHGYTPTGRRVVSRVDVVHGFALFDGAQRQADGSIEHAWTGTTEIVWDTQEALVENGQAVYRDEDGTEWDAKDISWQTDEEARLSQAVKGVDDGDA